MANKFLQLAGHRSAGAIMLFAISFPILSQENQSQLGDASQSATQLLVESNRIDELIASLENGAGEVSGEITHSDTENVDLVPSETNTQDAGDLIFDQSGTAVYQAPDVIMTNPIRPTQNSEEISDINASVAPTNVGVSDEIQRVLANSSGFLSPAERQALGAFYAAHAGQTIFAENEQNSITAQDYLSRADEQGLPNERYRVMQSTMSSSNTDAALREVMLAGLSLRYAQDMERGLIAPNDLGGEFDIAPQGRSPEQILNDMANASDLSVFYTNLEPQDPAYALLKAELAKMKTATQKADRAGAEKIPQGATLRPSQYGPRVKALRNRLKYLGFRPVYGQIIGQSTPASTAEEETVSNVEIVTPIDVDMQLFDQELFAAVQSFQTSRGLYADGLVGPQTLTLLNAGPEDHADSVLVGLERHRWGPNDYSGRRIFVNLANFKAEVRDDNQKTFETVVVVGKNTDDRRTPEFHHKMTHMVINPSWYIPRSIALKEYLPKLKRDPGMLSRSDITMTIRGSGQVVDARKINMGQFTDEDFPFNLKQNPGSGNALGTVKFMFPNKHNIYLHDTPSKSLFQRAVRMFSHGCVRVERPEDLAAHLLSPQANDPYGTFRSIRAGGKERHLDFKKPIPIYLTYHTAYMNDGGGLNYAPDGYGRDRLVKKALEQAGVEFY